MVFKKKPSGKAAKAAPTAAEKRKKERELLAEVSDNGYPLKRPVRVTFRLSDEENAALRKHCFEAGISIQTYLLDKIAPDLKM